MPVTPANPACADFDDNAVVSGNGIGQLTNPQRTAKLLVIEGFHSSTIVGEKAGKEKWLPLANNGPSLG